MPQASPPTNVSRTRSINHALRRARGLWKKHTGAATRFPRQVIDRFTTALRLRDRLNEANADEDCRDRAYRDHTQRLRALTERPRRNAPNQRFAKHLANHAAVWFVFLLDPATNHRAEQALKTPIVNRKVWGGNRTDAGGAAQAVACSVLQTCHNKAVDVFAFLSNAFRGVLGNLFT